MRTTTCNRYLAALLAAALTGLGWCGNVRATGLFSGVDVEKPNPVFSRSDDRIVAKFVPRAKSTSVTVEFAVVAGGRLASVGGVDFVTVDRPEVDIKNFKSAAFDIAVDGVAPGGTAVVVIRSDFFSESTAYFVFNPLRTPAWIRDAQTENRPAGDRIRELHVSVQDGSERDADGMANGSIQLIGGPRDSFWAYALGTLFIRFFGIFIVLSLLMAGMLASGRIFVMLNRWRERTAQGREGPAAESEASPAAAPTEPSPALDRVAAAIGAALYLDTCMLPPPSLDPPAADAGSTWCQTGRLRIMQERLAVGRQAGARQR